MPKIKYGSIMTLNSAIPADSDRVMRTHLLRKCLGAMLVLPLLSRLAAAFDRAVIVGFHSSVRSDAAYKGKAQIPISNHDRKAKIAI